MTISLENPWTVNWGATESSRSSLFCLPYAGGTSLIFQPWTAYLPKEMEIIAIELPGHGGRFREQLIQSLPKLISIMGPAIAPFLQKPYALFGHSLGATLSLELCRWLRLQRLRMPDHLFVSGRVSPQCSISRTATVLESDGEFIAYLQRLGGTPKEVLDDEEMLRLILPVLRADFALSENYRYRSEPPLDCPITAIGGLDDEETSGGRLREWGKQTTRAFNECWLPGGHFFLNSSRREL